MLSLPITEVIYPGAERKDSAYGVSDDLHDQWDFIHNELGLEFHLERFDTGLMILSLVDPEWGPYWSGKCRDEDTFRTCCVNMIKTFNTQRYLRWRIVAGQRGA